MQSVRLFLTFSFLQSVGMNILILLNLLVLGILWPLKIEYYYSSLFLTTPISDHFYLGCNREKLTSSTIEAVVSHLIKTELRDRGFRMIILHDCWAEPQRNPLTHRLEPSASQFPLGVKSLMHSLRRSGFVLGLSTSIGEKSCSQSQPGSL